MGKESSTKRWQQYIQSRKLFESIYHIGTTKSNEVRFIQAIFVIRKIKL